MAFANRKDLVADFQILKGTLSSFGIGDLKCQREVIWINVFATTSLSLFSKAQINYVEPLMLDNLTALTLNTFGLTTEAANI